MNKNQHEIYDIKVDDNMVSKTVTREDLQKLADKMNAMLDKHKVLKDPKSASKYELLRMEYDKKLKIWKKQHVQEAKRATGLKEGDRVEYVAVSPFGMTESFRGKVVVYQGMLRVRLDIKQMGKRYVAIHKGWKKIR